MPDDLVIKLQNGNSIQEDYFQTRLRCVQRDVRIEKITSIGGMFSAMHAITVTSVKNTHCFCGSKLRGFALAPELECVV